MYLLWLLVFEREISIAQDHRANFWVGRKETQSSWIFMFSLHLLPEKSLNAKKNHIKSKHKEGKSKHDFVWHLFSEID